MKIFYLSLTLLVLVLTCCKPMELKEFDQLGLKAVVHSDSSTMKLKMFDGSAGKANAGMTYYWFEHGRINTSQGYYSGKLLHGEFLEQDRVTKKPISSGSFSKGIKTGKWLSWEKNGSLKEVMIFKKGKLDGKLIKYDADGIPKDTLKYKMGKLIPEKVKQVDSTKVTLLSKMKRLLHIK